jgi:hypothetical protein
VLAIGAASIASVALRARPRTRGDSTIAWLASLIGAVTIVAGLALPAFLLCAVHNAGTC